MVLHKVQILVFNHLLYISWGRIVDHNENCDNATKDIAMATEILTRLEGEKVVTSSEPIKASKEITKPPAYVLTFQI